MKHARLVPSSVQDNEKYQIFKIDGLPTIRLFVTNAPLIEIHHLAVIDDNGNWFRIGDRNDLRPKWCGPHLTSWCLITTGGFDTPEQWFDFMMTLAVDPNV